MPTLTFTVGVSQGRGQHVISPALLLPEGGLTAHVAPGRSRFAEHSLLTTSHSHTSVSMLSIPPFKTRHDASVTLGKKMDK